MIAFVQLSDSRELSRAKVRSRCRNIITLSPLRKINTLTRHGSYTIPTMYHLHTAPAAQVMSGISHLLPSFHSTQLRRTNSTDRGQQQLKACE